MPGADPESYISFDARVKQAQSAWRGKSQFIFLPEGHGAAMTDIETECQPSIRSNSCYKDYNPYGIDFNGLQTIKSNMGLRTIFSFNPCTFCKMLGIVYGRYLVDE
jgi:hypothetical protein